MQEKAKPHFQGPKWYVDQIMVHLMEKEVLKNLCAIFRMA
jgi:hypothetical protein